MTRRMTAALALAAVVALALGGCATPAAPMPSAERVTALPEGADLLFVARAGTGSLEATGDTGTLTLDALTVVSWFTDRPARQAGLTTIEDALASLGWSSDTNAFGDNPPNAELTADELGADSVAVELRSAAVDAGRVTFDVTALGGATLASTSLTAAELFIDDGLKMLTRTLEGGITLNVQVFFSENAVVAQFDDFNGNSLGDVTIFSNNPTVQFDYPAARGTLTLGSDGNVGILSGDFEYFPQPSSPVSFTGVVVEWPLPENR